MTDGEGLRPRRVLAVLEAGAAQTALAAAAALADRHGAAFEVLACVEPPHDLAVLARLAGRAPERLLADLGARARAEAETALAEQLPGRDVALQVATGKTYLAVIRHVLATGCDVVVKAAEPAAGLQRFLFASTDQHLLRKCPCPVWLLTEGAQPVPRRVIAAVDVDDWDADEPETLFALNRRVIEAACAFADPVGGQVVVLHAWDAVGEGLVWAFGSSADARVAAETYVNEVLAARRAGLDRLLEAMAGAPVPLIPRLVRATPERAIAEQSAEVDADLVVMGTVARTGLSGVFIGNTAENIINALTRPVLAVKPAGFVSPLDPRYGYAPGRG